MALATSLDFEDFGNVFGIRHLSVGKFKTHRYKLDCRHASLFGSNFWLGFGTIEPKWQCASKPPTAPTNEDETSHLPQSSWVAILKLIILETIYIGDYAFACLLFV